MYTEPNWPKLEILDKYARFAQRSICFIVPLFVLLGAPLTYAQQTTGSSQVTVAPSALTFTAQEGGPAPNSQTITISGPSGTFDIEVVPSLGFTGFLTISAPFLPPGAADNGFTTYPAIITVGVIWPPTPADVLGYSGSIDIYDVTETSADPGPVHIANVPVTLSITPPAPSITPGGIVPVDSTVNTIQPGEWVSIYGSNLATSTVSWKGDFPTFLGGTTVTIDGRPAYLSLVSPAQINLQAPDDATTGSVSVVVTTPSMQATSTVTLAAFAPSFLLLDTKHVAGIIPRSNGSGAYGGGTYDILGPTGNSLGYATVAAKAGDTVELFGTGFGPTIPTESAGRAFSGVAPTTNPVNLLVNKVSVPPSFAGLSSAGVDQINLTVPPGLGTGDVPLVATVGGAQTQSSVVISLQ
jgi:uncharacterized protein (TIGR03437 family)